MSLVGTIRQWDSTIQLGGRPLVARKATSCSGAAQNASRLKDNGGSTCKYRASGRCAGRRRKDLEVHPGLRDAAAGGRVRHRQSPQERRRTTRRSRPPTSTAGPGQGIIARFWDGMRVDRTTLLVGWDCHLRERVVQHLCLVRVQRQHGHWNSCVAASIDPHRVLQARGSCRRCTGAGVASMLRRSSGSWSRTFHYNWGACAVRSWPV